MAGWNCVTPPRRDRTNAGARERRRGQSRRQAACSIRRHGGIFERDRFAFTSESLHKQTRDSPCLSSCVRVWRLPPGCTAGLWKAGQFATLCTPEPPESTKPVFVVAPHPSDASLLATAGYDGLLRVWDVHSGSQLCQMRSASRPHVTRRENEALQTQYGHPTARLSAHPMSKVSCLYLVSARTSSCAMPQRSNSSRATPTH